MNKTFEEMTVKELREESRRRGLTLEHKGHKFTKPELIERIKAYDAEQDEAWTEPENKEEEQSKSENKKTDDTFKDIRTPDVVIEKEEEDGYITYAKTLAEIEQKYGNRKKQEIYDNELKVGSFVVFVHYVEAKNGNIYKKLRTAKVVGINRKKELVRVSTLLGTEMELHFEELLYIKGSVKNCSYPKDIATYLREQRTEKGKVLINERFTENVVNG